MSEPKSPGSSQRASSDYLTPSYRRRLRDPTYLSGSSDDEDDPDLCGTAQGPCTREICRAIAARCTVRMIISWVPHFSFRFFKVGLNLHFTKTPRRRCPSLKRR